MSQESSERRGSTVRDRFHKHQPYDRLDSPSAATTSLEPPAFDVGENAFNLTPIASPQRFLPVAAPFEPPSAKLGSRTTTPTVERHNVTFSERYRFPSDQHLQSHTPRTLYSKSLKSSAQSFDGHSVRSNYTSNDGNSVRSIFKTSFSGSSASTDTLILKQRRNDPPLKYQKVVQRKQKWYKGWSTRRIILLIAGVVVSLTLALAISLVLELRSKEGTSQGLTPTWRPAIGTTWQIQLSQPAMNPTMRAYVYDIDLFDNNSTTIDNLHAMGRRVICYFSAGTYEPWRPDASDFPEDVLGNELPGWNGERWIDTRQKSVRDIMEARIKLAASQGCDGIDPDNVDGYTSTNTSFPLTVSTAVDYIKYMSTQAHLLNMAIGLKNSPELVNQTLSSVEWALNEGCATNQDCDVYQPFIQAGKPVFHIEYSTNSTSSVLSQACTATGSHGFSNLVKRTTLDEWAMECPFSVPGFELF